ncbi:hypothetical protein FACS189499_06370 [Clostridia bacterium]|nr:hypothetical protein FACS189499_06370 [Clostridia bacterium]
MGVFIIIYIMVTVYSLTTSQLSINSQRKNYKELYEIRVSTEDDNRRLERNLEETNRAAYMEEIARSRLQYAYPNERIYYIDPE